MFDFFPFYNLYGEILNILEDILLTMWHVLNKVSTYKLVDNLAFNNIAFIILTNDLSTKFAFLHWFPSIMSRFVTHVTRNLEFHLVLVIFVEVCWIPLLEILIEFIWLIHNIGFRSALMRFSSWAYDSSLMWKYFWISSKE